MLLRTVFLEKYLPQNLRITSPSTEKHYRISIDHLDEMNGAAVHVEELTDELGLRFARWMTKRRLSPATVNQRLGYLRAIWRWCAKRQLTTTWPTFNSVVEPQKTPRAWTIDQIRSLIASCRKEQGSIAGTPAADWWVNLHRFLWETGERIGATLQVEWCDIEPGRRAIAVPARMRKGKCKDMLYVVSAELMTALQLQRRPYHEQLFPWPFHQATLYFRYDRILTRAGLPCDGKSKFHRMRKSFASHLKAAGGDATYALRHTSARITMDNYLDPTIVDCRPSYTILPPLDETG